MAGTSVPLQVVAVAALRALFHQATAHLRPTWNTRTSGFVYSQLVYHIDWKMETYLLSHELAAEDIILVQNYTGRVARKQVHACK